MASMFETSPARATGMWSFIRLGSSKTKLRTNTIRAKTRPVVRLLLMAAQVSPPTTPGTGLKLEIPEGVLMRDTEATLATLLQLKELGVRLAIDDFGTGYSSLSYLHRFPIDVLKIDRSFVASMFNGPDETALLRSILKLSETLHLETVAEGIEDAEQLAELRSCGAAMGQGFYFARPLTAEAISALLAAGDGRIAPPSARRANRPAARAAAGRRCRSSAGSRIAPSSGCRATPT